MPAKNSVKQFVANSFYHLYNRGVEKRNIFIDQQDYHVFVSYLANYLSPKDTIALQSTLQNPEVLWSEKDKALKLLRMNNFFQDVELIAYCLMPTHFHLLVKQREDKQIDRFMNSLCTRYSMYLNRKYKRIGTLFQDVYKAVLVESDEQLLHLTRYIHLNPAFLQVLQGDALQNYEYSSYRDYIGLAKSSWLSKDYILDSIGGLGDKSLFYRSFVEGERETDENFEAIKIDQEDII